jgi:hypothetical protein
MSSSKTKDVSSSWEFKLHNLLSYVKRCILYFRRKTMTTSAPTDITTPPTLAQVAQAAVDAHNAAKQAEADITASQAALAAAQADVAAKQTAFTTAKSSLDAAVAALSTALEDLTA